jgi:hypothetical protein
MLPAMQTWRSLNSGWRVWVWSRDDRRRLVQEAFPAWSSFFDALPSGVERADLFKYAVLSSLGGVYADVDAECRVPIERWGQVGSYGGLLGGGGGGNGQRAPPSPPLPSSALIVGVEALHDDAETYKQAKHYWPVQLSAWTIAASPGHPALGPPGHALFPASQRETARQLLGLFGGNRGGGGDYGEDGPLPLMEAIGLAGEEVVGERRSRSYSHRKRRAFPPRDDFDEGAFEEEEEEEEEREEPSSSSSSSVAAATASTAKAAAAARAADQAARGWYREAVLNRTGPFLLTKQVLAFAREAVAAPGKPLRIRSHLEAARLLRGDGLGGGGGWSGAGGEKGRAAVAILPLDAFGAGQPHSRAGPTDGPGVLVVHKFLSSWRGSGDGRGADYWCEWTGGAGGGGA